MWQVFSSWNPDSLYCIFWCDVFNLPDRKNLKNSDDGQPRKYIFNECGINIYFSINSMRFGPASTKSLNYSDVKCINWENALEIKDNLKFKTYIFCSTLYLMFGISRSEWDGFSSVEVTGLSIFCFCLVLLNSYNMFFVSVWFN